MSGISLRSSRVLESSDFLLDTSSSDSLSLPRWAFSSRALSIFFFKTVSWVDLILSLMLNMAADASNWRSSMSKMYPLAHFLFSYLIFHYLYTNWAALNLINSLSYAKYSKISHIFHRRILSSFPDFLNRYDLQCFWTVMCAFTTICLYASSAACQAILAFQATWMERAAATHRFLTFLNLILHINIRVSFFNFFEARARRRLSLNSLKCCSIWSMGMSTGGV